MARCRGEGCGEEIDFVVLRSGKTMPVEGRGEEEYRVWLDREQMPGHVAPKKLVLVVDGEVLTTWLGRTPNGPVDGPCRVIGVESHFAYCKAAEQFR
jgi:hypothetical protein